ncbi:hypothetical protein [Undibacterium sp.]|uniref:dCTP deaminase domain-containing protein n=1 Tax=Undibacterium sp. TaxID=1914977 RepID=UPI002731695E|nr:hypothetical protein [Undibacterium sp.]MDP1979480.1 hypothetical protein [Undibacterium sp.]
MTILKIKGRTVQNQEEFIRNSMSSNSLIYTNAKLENIEEYSIELSLGAGWNQNYSDENKNLIKITDSITIQRNESIVVEVAEEIRVPHNRYGIVLPTGSMFLSRGIIVTPAKVEPSFNGKLKLRLFNTTSRKVEIARGAKLGSVIFLSTESTIQHEPIHRFAEISDIPETKCAKLKRWLAANPTTWITWLITFLTGSLATFVLTYLLYYKPMLESKSPQTSNTKQATSNQVAPKP